MPLLQPFWERWWVKISLRGRSSQWFLFCFVITERLKVLPFLGIIWYSRANINTLQSSLSFRCLPCFLKWKSSDLESRGSSVGWGDWFGLGWFLWDVTERLIPYAQVYFYSKVFSLLFCGFFSPSERWALGSSTKVLRKGRSWWKQRESSLKTESRKS